MATNSTVYKGNVPDWAPTILERCYRILGTDRTLGELVWRNSTKHFSSGTTYSRKRPNGTHELPYRIVVTAGTCDMDALVTLVHEIAHWSLTHEHAHGPTFWKRAFMLYHKLGLPNTYALYREARYVKSSVWAVQDVWDVVPDDIWTDVIDYIYNKRRPSVKYGAHPKHPLVPDRADRWEMVLGLA